MTSEVVNELWKRAIRYKCPTCSALPRNKCKTKSGKTALEPHAARLLKSEVKKPKAKRKLPTVHKKKQAEKDPRGRHTAYLESYDDIAFDLTIIGAIDDELAEAFNVSVTTLNNWKKQYPNFTAKIRAGKLRADAQVGRSLFDRALGVKVEESRQYLDEEKKPQTLTTTKELPGDVAAIKFFLKNRRPDQFKENIGVTDGQGGAFSLIIHEELRPEGK